MNFTTKSSEDNNFFPYTPIKANFCARGFQGFSRCWFFGLKPINREELFVVFVAEPLALFGTQARN